jgi:putative glutamine amidotransferase
MLAKSDDGSIEAFRHVNKKILGIMWHPERYNKIKKFDLDFIKKFL